MTGERTLRTAGARWRGALRRLPRSLRRGVVLGSALLWMAGCGDDTPEPGEVRIVVSESVPLGGAVVELAGEGLLGVRGPPGVSVVARAVPVEGTKAFPRLRVVAIQETPGPLSLIVEVADRTAPLVGATLVEASGAEDQLLPASLLPRVRVLR